MNIGLPIKRAELEIVYPVHKALNATNAVGICATITTARS